jgi:hypothetical protein
MKSAVEKFLEYSNNIKTSIEYKTIVQQIEESKTDHVIAKYKIPDILKEELIAYGYVVDGNAISWNLKDIEERQERKHRANLRRARENKEILLEDMGEVITFSLFLTVCSSLFVLLFNEFMPLPIVTNTVIITLMFIIWVIVYKLLEIKITLTKR